LLHARDFGRAGFGAALVIVFGGAIPFVADYGVAGGRVSVAALACALVFVIGSARGMNAESMVLAGIALLFCFRRCSRWFSTGVARSASAGGVLAFRELAQVDLDKLSIVAVVTASPFPSCWAMLGN